MPVKNTKDLNTLVHVVCEKRGVDPDNIKLMLLLLIVASEVIPDPILF